MLLAVFLIDDEWHFNEPYERCSSYKEFHFFFLPILSTVLAISPHYLSASFSFRKKDTMKLQEHN
jgi:hypothetical protein